MEAPHYFFSVLAASSSSNTSSNEGLFIQSPGLPPSLLGTKNLPAYERDTPLLFLRFLFSPYS